MLEQENEGNEGQAKIKFVRVTMTRKYMDYTERKVHEVIIGGELEIIPPDDVDYSERDMMMDVFQVEQIFNSSTSWRVHMSMVESEEIENSGE